MRIAERHVQVSRIDRVERLERPERVEPCLRRRTGTEHRFERSDGRFVLPFKEQPLGRVPVPAVRIAKQRHQLGRAFRSQLRRSGIAKAVGSDAVHAPRIAPGLEVDEFQHVERNVDRFQDLAAHVETIERAVRRVDEIHRPKPVVRGADKLGPGVGPAFLERHAVGRQQHAMDQVVLCVADDRRCRKTLGG